MTLLVIFALGSLVLSFIGKEFSKKPHVVSCFTSTNEGQSKIEDCVTKAKDHYELRASNIHKILFNHDNLVNVILDYENQCYWANKDQKMMRSHCYDNGADDFKEGLTRYKNKEDMFGFMNKKLEIVIPAQYKFAMPFSNGHSEVCLDCKRISTPGSEYNIVDGKKWSLIDKKGNTVSHCKMKNKSPVCNIPTKN